MLHIHRTAPMVAWVQKEAWVAAPLAARLKTLLVAGRSKEHRFQAYGRRDSNGGKNDDKGCVRH